MAASDGPNVPRSSSAYLAGPIGPQGATGPIGLLGPGGASGNTGAAGVVAPGTVIYLFDTDPVLPGYAFVARFDVNLDRPTDATGKGRRVGLRMFVKQ